MSYQCIGTVFTDNSAGMFFSGKILILISMIRKKGSDYYGNYCKLYQKYFFYIHTYDDN